MADHHNQAFLQQAAEARRRIREVTPEQADEHIAQGALLIDVRDQSEFDAGHLPGARLLPRDTLPERIGDLVTDKHAPIVCYCGGGNRGALAADTLQTLGYTQVVSIAGATAHVRPVSDPRLEEPR